MKSWYRHRFALRIDEVSDYVGRIVTPDELPEPVDMKGVHMWPKQDIDDWLDAQRGPGGLNVKAPEGRQPVPGRNPKLRGQCAMWLPELQVDKEEDGYIHIWQDHGNGDISTVIVSCRQVEMLKEVLDEVSAQEVTD